ncbi:MAG: heterodisulfide reductase-related iron-sulfur binding cluster, partial [Methanosarcinales archaeon]
MIIYFPGCTIKEKLPQIMEKTIDLLDSMKIDYAIKDGCCGSFLYYTG